ncbi:MAG: ATP-binding protein [Anaerolineales bacterium]
MVEKRGDIESLRREIEYYERRLDELAGENVKLDRSISGLRHELRQKRHGFGLLSELQQEIGAHKEISSIFEITIQAINSTLGMDKTVVLTPTAEENCYRPSQWIGFQQEQAEQLSSLSIRFPPGSAEGSGLLLVNKSSESTSLIEEIRTAFGLPYFVCLPVIVDNTPIGLLLSGRLTEAQPYYHPLDQGDVDTFQAIAGLISASIRNLRLAVFKEMDRLKTEFFANISHEFRTPITLTLGPLDQILKGRYGDISDANRNQLQVINRNQQRLLGLVNQILDLTKLEAGRMQLKAAPMRDMNRFVRERTSQFESAAEQRGIELRVSLDPQVNGADLFIDRGMFEKLLFNLVSNALKFTEQGHVQVSTEIQEGTFRLAVSDTGTGIKQDQLPHIFDRFRQADGSESRERAGTGIGLALVKEIAKSHGGDVIVHSQYGKGSLFQVSIPLGKAHLDPASVVESAEEELTTSERPQLAAIVHEGATDQVGGDQANQEAEAAFDPAKATVLYVEDNPDLRNHVRDLLAVRYNVFLALDGSDGLEKARKYMPDLILTDQMMPHMSGRDLLQAIREDTELRSTPVVFLTARAATESRIESLDAGADDYLAKPFDEGELLVRVKNLLRARAQEQELAKLNRRLEAKVEEQMAELVRSGEIRRFLPEALVESVLTGQLGLEECFERRKVTALFADMVQFTTLTDRLEPEDIAPILNEYVSEMTAAAVAHRGTIEKFIGDGVAVIFGAPKKEEVEAQVLAAIKAAFDMQASVQKLSAVWRRQGLSGDLSLRIGINTGYCTVGVFGRDLLKNYAALGTPVNVAARLQAEASAGAILCGFPSYAVVQERVRAKACGALSLRGISHPVEAYEILELLDEEAGP